MSFIINTVINDTLILRDYSNTAITGKVSGDFATIEAYQVSAPATTAVVTLTEIGLGEYRISFTPTTASTWTSHLVYNSGGVFREFTETYDVLSDGSAPVIVIPTATVGGLTQTLTQLIERTARRLGDYEPLTATSDGTTTTFIDILNINTGTEEMKGRILVTADGSIHRITGFNDATYTITFIPTVSLTYAASGQAAFLLNKRGKGFRYDEYKHAINTAINDAFPLGLIELFDDAVATFDMESPSITVPAAFTHVHTVSWSDADGFEHVLPKATGTNEYGWLSDSARGEIRILGNPAWMADGLSVNLTGYGRQGELSAGTDTCALNAEYIVARACYHLCYGALDKDQKFQQSATTYLNESMKLRTRLRTLSKSSNRSIRAA